MKCSRRSEWPSTTPCDVDVGEHRRRDLAGERARRRLVHGLGVDADARAARRVDQCASAVNGAQMRDVDAVEPDTAAAAPATKASASAIVLCIFQLPAISGVRLIAAPPRPEGLPSTSSSEAPPPVDRWVDVVGETELRERRGAVAAAHDRRPRRLGDGLGDARVPAANGSSSNAPIGPFQNTVPALVTSPRVALGGARADVEAHPAVGHVDAVELAELGVRGEAVAEHEVDGQLAAAVGRSAASSACAPARVLLLAQRGADSWPWALKNGKHMAPPIRIASARSRNASITPILSVTLAPPTTATSGRCGSSRMPRERLDLALEQAARARSAAGGDTPRSRRARGGRRRTRR